MSGTRSTRKHANDNEMPDDSFFGDEPKKKAEPEWLEIVPFGDPKVAAKPAAGQVPFPMDALPRVVADFVRSLSDSFLCPPDLPAVVALGAISSSIAGRVRVRATRDWFEPANLYLLAVLPPSMHKSPIVHQIFSAVEEEERDLRERRNEEEKALSIKREVAKSELKIVKRKSDEASKARMAELLTEIAELEPKPERRLLVDDITTERLAVLMQESGPVAIASAEARPFELMSGMYRKAGETDVDLYLKAFSGDPVRVSRLSRPEVYVPRPTLTITLCIQPAALEIVAKRPEFRGRGLIARFLTSYPQTNVGNRVWKDAKPIDPVCREKFNTALRRLLSLPCPGPNDATPFVDLSPEAAAVFAAYRDAVEVSMKTDRQLSEWQDLGGKLAGHCMRLAVCLHMAEHPIDGVTRPIDETTLKRAVAIAEYFTVHTLATWDGGMGGEKAAHVAAWLAREPRGPRLTTRQLMRPNWRYLKTAEEARQAAKELADRGYLMADGPNRWLVSPLACPRSTQVSTASNDTQPIETISESEVSNMSTAS